MRGVFGCTNILAVCEIMIFKCDNNYTWDTWMYYNEGKYYLYYLITDYSPGEGFGVAVSSDGVHYTDYGKCISASDKMVFYLGTGSVWKSQNFERDGYFICNYSEWRRDEIENVNYQNILFARSKDLIHWDKLGDDYMFKIDESMYVRNEFDGGRWDCIYPIKIDNGYMGFFTATPKDYLGCGFAVTSDGVNWTAKKPPQFDMQDKNIKDGIEAGAVCAHNGKYYMLMGTYVNNYGMAVMVSNEPNGVYAPQEKNFALLSNGSFMHAYFMRILVRDGELLVNHHVLMRDKNEHDRNVTYFAPLKKIVFDGEILRLRWASMNDALKGDALDAPDFAHGFMMQIKGYSRDRIRFNAGGAQVDFVFNHSVGGLKIYEDGELKEDMAKDMQFKSGDIRIIYRNTLLEVYVDDYFVACYTFRTAAENVELYDDVKYDFWRLNI